MNKKTRIRIAILALLQVVLIVLYAHACRRGEEGALRKQVGLSPIERPVLVVLTAQPDKIDRKIAQEPWLRESVEWEGVRNGINLESTFTWNQCAERPTYATLKLLGADVIGDWSHDPPVYCDPEDEEECLESMPMIWPGYFAANPCHPLGGNSDWVLGINEPELAGQANRTPEQGAVIQRQMEICYPDRLIASPATTTDPDWLGEMYDAYVSLYGQAPRFDALAVHCYAHNGVDVMTRCRYMLDRMDAYADEWGIDKIMVTEYAAVDMSRTNQLRLLFRTYGKVVLEMIFIGQHEYPNLGNNFSLVECEGQTLTARGLQHMSFVRYAVLMPMVSGD